MENEKIETKVNDKLSFTKKYDQGYKKREGNWDYSLREQKYLWEKHYKRCKEFERLNDEQNREICLNGWTKQDNFASVFGPPPFSGINRYSNDFLFQALRSIEEKDIAQHFKKHKIKYIANSNRNPKAKMHRERLKSRIYKYRNQIKKRIMKQETYEELHKMAEEGKLLDGLYKETGNDINNRQIVLLNLTDLRHIAYFLMYEEVDSESAEKLFRENPELLPRDFIAMGFHKEDYIPVLERNPNVFDRALAWKRLGLDEK